MKAEYTDVVRKGRVIIRLWRQVTSGAVHYEEHPFIAEYKLEDIVSMNNVSKLIPLKSLSSYEGSRNKGNSSRC